MLDTETKARIDSARDILVGKVPDPKSQVEQITIALIYKFMDDMDRESEELGGKATFFSGKFKRYAWPKLLDKRHSGHERLLLYAEGIEKMNENKNIPQLFRDIFKGAFLPYRDPETLNLFLKEINGFTYDHSERLGDAFEYLLSVLGTQGDAGQFRTPRHIIDFIVAVVEPQKHETVLDPACGTAGFLISAYKHILRSNEDLTPDERARLMTNFRGYDISPDMVRLSLVNLYLHGFANPVIHEYDTLTSEERWDERCDVILANPPFMTPKGGIRPHNRFSIKARRSEVLFADYIAEHLNPGGRAGVIVPEGIIFQSQNAYKNLRKMLVEDYLWAVVSLPAGVFNPYSGVKTSILLMDRNLAKRTDEILFVKVENDGFDCGAQRRPIEGSQLGEAQKWLLQWKHGRKKAQKAHGELVHAVTRKRILESPDYGLSGERYAELLRINTKWPRVPLGDVAQVDGTLVDPTLPEHAGLPHVSAENMESGNGHLTEIRSAAEDKVTSGNYLFDSGCVLYSKLRPYLRKAAVVSFRGLCSADMYPIRPNAHKLIPDFLLWVLLSREFTAYADTHSRRARMPKLNRVQLLSFEMPLPPLDVQQKIVAEVDGYRKVIEGARQIIANYRPVIQIDPEWPNARLSEVMKLASGKFLPEKETRPGAYAVYGGNGIKGRHNKYFLERPVLVIGRVGAYCGAVHMTEAKSWVTDNALYVAEYLQKVDQRYLAVILADLNLNQFAKIGGQPSISQSTVLSQTVPLPPLEVQREIAAKIEAEQALVNSNHKLIEIYERKIQAKLAEVWGEPAEVSAVDKGTANS